MTLIIEKDLLLNEMVSFRCEKYEFLTLKILVHQEKLLKNKEITLGALLRNIIFNDLLAKYIKSVTKIDYYNLHSDVINILKFNIKEADMKTKKFQFRITDLDKEELMYLSFALNIKLSNLIRALVLIYLYNEINNKGFSNFKDFIEYFNSI